LAPELGKALKTAWVHQHGDDEAPFDTGVAHYRVREDALFLEEVYGRFRTRPGFARACGEHEESRAGMAHDVAAALQNARGFVQARRSGARSSNSIAIVPGG
jgi:hypothetical protein